MKKYIGVLDSGVGGLSVLAELYKIMPEKNYIFFGDTKNMPYGTKSVDEIYVCTKKILEFFIKNNVKNVIFACNTTSATVYDILQNEYKNTLKIFPLIQPVVKYAIKGLKDSDTISVLATKATVNAGKYSKSIKEINPNINVEEIDCTGFVEIVENRLYKEECSIKLIKSKLSKINSKRIILGCTHYPYLINIFKTILPFDTEYFNPANCLANIVKNEINDNSKEGDIKFYVSDNPERFKLSGKYFFDITKTVNLAVL